MLKSFINQTNATLRGFETQLGQFASDLKNRPQGTLPSDTETPKGTQNEHVKSVFIKCEDCTKEIKQPGISTPGCQKDSKSFVDKTLEPKFFPAPKEA